MANKATGRFELWHIWDGYHAIRQPDGELWRGPCGNVQWYKPIAQAYLKLLRAGETPTTPYYTTADFA